MATQSPQMPVQSNLAHNDKERYRDGVIRLFEDPSAARADTAWAALAAWAWGASRAMDYFETDSRVDAKRGRRCRPLARG